MAQQDSDMAPVTFHDVAAYFSEEEWKLLRDWQKELYKNVMKEIQQAFISLGPLIAASVFSLRAKEKEDRFPVDSQDSERSHSINRSTGDTIANSDILFRKKGDESQKVKDIQDKDRRRSNECLSKDPEEMVEGFEGGQRVEKSLMDHPVAEGGESCPGHSSVPLDFAAVVSFRIKEEGETDFTAHQDSERRDGINCSTGIPFVSTELEASWRDHVGAEGGEIRPGHSSGPAVNIPLESFSNEEAGVTYSMRNLDSKRTESIGSLACVSKSVNSTEQHQSSSWDGAHSYSEFGRSCSLNLDCINQNRIHVEVKADACTEYGSSFNPIPSIVGHQGTQIGQKPHASTEYGNRFTESAVMSQHQKLHTALKRCVCSQCGNCFDRSPNIIAHQQINNGEQENICSECDNILYQSTHLNRDEGKHTGERLFICNECGKSFKMAQTLMRHQRIHTGERHYICSVCGKSFRRSDALVRHQLIHTGEKPYICHQCGKNFRQISHLIRHQRMHMGKKLH